MKKKLIVPKLIVLGDCCTGVGGVGGSWMLKAMEALTDTIVNLPKGIKVCLLTGRGVEYGFAVAEALRRPHDFRCGPYGVSC